MQKDLEGLVQQVISIGQEAASFIKSNFEKVSLDQVETKEQNSLVSFVDKTAETMIVSGLTKLLPEAGFITEEETPDDEDHDCIWIIDPLDGTTNFLQGLPHFSVSIALQKGNEIIAGVVIDIMQNDTYHAIQNRGAFRNGKRISVSQTQKLSEAVICTGFPYSREARSEAVKNTLGSILDHVRGVRRLGSAALDMTYVACGRLDAFYESTLNIWDIAAGIILVKEAGGQVHDYRGRQTGRKEIEVIAGNDWLSKDILTIIQKEYGY